MSQTNVIEGFRGLVHYWKVLTSAQPRLYAFYLSTEADRIATAFLLENREELSEMTGDWCVVLAFFNSRFTAKPSDRLHMLTSVQTATSVSHEAYEVANFFGIPYDRLPCLVFFGDLNSRQAVVLELEADSHKTLRHQLRKVFGLLRQNPTLKGAKRLTRRTKLKAVGIMISKSLKELLPDLLKAGRKWLGV